MSGWGIGQVDFDSDDDSVDAVETPLDDLDFDWTPRDGDLAEQGAPEPEDDDARQPVSDVVAGANLVRHSSFESDRQWSVGPGWQVPFPWESAYHGSRVARIETYGPPSELVSNLIPVDVSRPMWASAWGWVLTVGVGFGRVLLREFDASGAVLAETVVGDYETQTTGWVKVSRQFVARRQDASKQTEWDVRTTGCRLVLIGSGVIDWRVDAVQVAVGDSESVYAPAPNEDLLGENIDPGTLPKEALEPGLAVIEVVDTLPTPDAFRVAMLTSDGRLYSAVDDAWRDVVSASELTGLLASDQIADDAVLAQHLADGAVTAPAIQDSALDLAHFGSGIRPIQVVGVLPTLPDPDYPVGAVVLLTTDQKLHRSTGSAWVSTVPTSDLTGRLLAGQLGTANFQNFVWNPGFEQDHESWLPGSATIEGTVVRSGAKSSKWVYAGGSVYLNNIWSNPYSANVADSAIPCVPGDKFYGEVWGRISAASVNGGIYARFEFYTAAGAVVSASNGTYMNTLDNTQWKRAAQVVTVPATAAYVRFRPMADANQAPSVTFYLDDAFCTKQVTGDALEDAALSLAKFANGLRPIQVLGSLPSLPDASYPIGAVVLLTTDQKLYRSATGNVWERRIHGEDDIEASTITGDRIVAGTITAGLIGAGQITTEKLTVGSVGDNTVINSGFEDLQESDNTKPAGWALDGNSTAGGGWGVSTSSPAAGARSATLTVASGTDIAAIITSSLLDIPVVAGEFWYISAAMKGSTAAGGGARIYAHFYDSAGGAYSGSFETWGWDTAWTKRERTVQVPGGKTRMRIGIWAVGSQMTGPAPTFPFTGYVDDVTAKKVTVTAMIADNAITTPKILAGAIETSHMDAGSINASVLMAGTITTEKLTVGSVGDNAILNGGFEDLKASDATKPARMEMGGLTSWATETTEVLTGARSVKTTVSGSGVSGWVSVEAGAGYIPVVGGEQWYGSVYAKAGQASAGGMFFRAWFYDKGAVPLSAPDDYEDFITGNRPFAVTWTKYEGIVTVPAGAAFMRVGFYHHGPGLGAVTYPHAVYWDDLTARKVIVSASIADGAIVANKIAAGAVLADKVAAGAITTEKLTVGGMSDNAVRNGSFEDLQYADATKPASWQEANNATAGGDWGLTTTAPAAGTRCLTLLVPTASDVAAVETTAPSLIPVVPGEQWYVSGQFKGSTAATGTGRKLYVHWFNAALAYQSSSSAEGTWETTWTRSEGVFTVPSGIAYMRVAVWASGLTMTGSPTYPFTGFVDDVVARKVVISAVIADGAIIAPKIAAGQVTAEKLTVGSIGDNVLLNGSFEDAQQADATKPALFEASDAVGSYTWALETALANVRTGSRSLKTVVTGTGDRVAPRNPLSHAIPVVPGERWYIGVWHKASTAHTAGLYLRAWFWKADGSISATPSQDVVANGPLVASWTLREGTVTVPSDAAKMLVGFYHYGTGMAGATFPHTVYWDDLVARKMVVSAVIADGAVTAQKMVIADFTSLVENPHFGEGDTGWIHIGDPTAGTSIVNDPANAYRGNWVGKFVNRSTQQLGNNLIFPVQPGEKFFVTGTMKCAPGTTAGNAYVRLRYAGADKVALVAAHTTAAWTAADTTYSTKTFESEAPAGAVYARLDFQFPTIAAGAWYAGEATCRRMNEGTLIVDGAISANKIAAGTITADRLFVSGGRGSALNADPMTADATAWTTHSGSNWVVGTVTDGKVGNTVLRSVASAGHAWMYETRKVDLDPTKVYRLRAWVRRISGDRGVYLMARFLDGSGVNITAPYTGWPGAGSFVYWGLVGATTATLPADSTWREYSITFGAAGAIIPTGAKTVQIGAILNHSGTGTTEGVVEVQDVRIEEVIPGTLIQDGAITTNKMVANTISGDRIAAGTLAASKLVVTDLSNAFPDASLLDPAFLAAPAVLDPAGYGLTSALSTGVWRLGTANTTYHGTISTRVEPGSQIRLVAQARADAGVVTVYYTIYSDAAMTNVVTAQTSIGTGANGSLGTLSAYVTVPSQGRYLKWTFITDASTPANTFIAGLGVFRRMSGELIVDGAISAAKVAANAIDASKMVITDLTNLADNPGFESGDVNWTKGSTWVITNSGARTGSWCAQKASGVAAALRNSFIVPVEVGDDFRAEAWLKTGTGGGAYVRICRLNASKVEIGTQPGNTVAAGTSTWTLSAVNYTVAAGTYFIRVEVSSDNTGGTAYADDVRLLRRANGSLVVDGSISATKIAAGQVTAEKLSVASLGGLNLVQNGGFEDLSESDATKPASWAKDTGVSTANGTWATQTSPVVSGARSLALGLPASTDSAAAVDVYAPVVAGEWIYAAAMMRGDSAHTGNGGRIYFHWYRSNGTYINSDYQAVAIPNGTWGRVSAKFQAASVALGDPDEAAYVRIAVAVIGGAMTGATYPFTLSVDDVWASRAITADALKVTDLSAISANLGSITVDTANIANLAVTTLKIGDQQVTFSKIADGAVSGIKIGDGGVLPQKFDTLAPKAPTGLAVTSAVVVAPDGTSVVVVRASWTLPTQNTDNSALVDLDGTVVEATSAFTGTAESPTPDWTYPQVLSVAKEQNYVTFDGVGGSRRWWVRARCIDIQGNRSPVTSVVEHTTVGDATAPDAPTALVAVAGNRGVGLRWNPTSASDLSHYEVQQAITTTAPGGVPDVPTDGTITLATSAAADDIIDTATAHGQDVGDVVYFPTMTGGAGLSGAITLATSAAADDIIDTAAAHDITPGEAVVFPTLTGGAGLVAGQVYYVVDANLGAQTLKVSATPGGTPVNFTTDITAGTIRPLRPYYVLAANLGAQTLKVSATPGGAAVNFTTDITAGTMRKSLSAWSDVMATKSSAVWVPGLQPFGGPPATTSFYWFRVRSVDLSGNASPWTTTDESSRASVSAQPLLVGQADIAANSITASHIHASGITADVLTSGLLQVSTGVADRIDGIGVTQTGGGGTKEVGHWDENGLVVRDYTTQSDYLKLTSGKVELYTGGNLVTAITPTGIDAGAIRFGQLPGGHNVVPNSSFEVAAYTSQTTLPNSGYTTVQQPNATISTGVITMTAVN